MMSRNAFEFRAAPEEADPEVDQLAMLDAPKEEEVPEEEIKVGIEGGTDDLTDPNVAGPSDDLDKDGLEELEEMEKQLRLEENPVLDFVTVEEE
ncbi:hypothetical protein A3E39_04445 [Candidatus Uhrbacteria bacterium RIFCSPHIGHO2_12_FULL_60_25]|uniref:Uncharacterized protein n=1 Tax=Candidatus Uhrbacteria bacterium RIFCSPHIGHO2_12_FULL_60_25 TaxID=1802399 RepID=A0A1F7UIL1_9BACT|nr:MAG: hypothetical protein A3D73_00995 [Candidatus Uhrbacteria bacterium RIFCSPHIGHO2_02_FULL_60_44]OGL78136.1 MAG: hypothetical protein A3E39_04445 [Candidatus Uhrbacteria bacterium RIFCSPHIGHO2_12_FULL_60_25]